jgi:hypothetical protein
MREEFLKTASSFPITHEGEIRDYFYNKIEPRGNLIGSYNACFGVGPNTYMKGQFPALVLKKNLEKYPLYYHIGRIVLVDYDQDRDLPIIHPIGFDVNRNRFYHLITRTTIETNDLINKLCFISSFWHIYKWGIYLSYKIPEDVLPVWVIPLDPGDIFAVPFARETVVVDSDISAGNYWRLSEIGTIADGDETNYLGIIWGMIDGRRVWLMYAPYFHISRALANRII